jgi:hypothetical protein
MLRAAAAAASVIVAAVAGVVTTYATQHSSFGLWAALGVLVILGAILQALVTGRDKPSAGPAGSGSDAASPPLDVAAKDPRLIFHWVPVETFTGRRWLTDEVDTFIAEKPCGYIFVTADTGMGKTMFAAWLVKTRGYVSHFPRYADGKSVHGALQNLSAQLIRKYRLRDMAPGGTVPSWAQTPSGFESLLTAAASHLDKDRLVLVVDGLDEAEPGGGDMPFGLPVLLPDKVFVIATYRTGSVPPPPDVPSTTLRIRQDDPRNRHDIQEYLTRSAGETDIAARLAGAGMSQAAFVELLAARCDGVWVYLWYVLEGLRLAQLDPNALVDLPAGLQAYYAAQIGRWKTDPAWAKGLLPLLATLGAAGEPLSAVTLAGLAGDLEPAAVSHWCDLTLRSMLTVTVVGSGELVYDIYHASFREVLRGDRPAGTDGAPSDDILAGELRQATLAAHRRIADRYLELFGGLDAGLQVLAADPGRAGVDGGYPLRHLIRHLGQGERTADLYRVLVAEHPAGDGRFVNVWYAAQDHADCIARYLEDLRRAGQVSAAATDAELGRRRPAPTLGQEIRCALMAASITSRTNNISAGLLRQAVSTGLWSPSRGLDYARRLPDTQGRIDALVAVHTFLAPEQRSEALGEALAAANAVTDDTRRAWALISVVPVLPADQKPGALRQALAAAGAASYPETRAAALSALAPELSAELLTEAWATATGISDEYARARAMTGLAPYLPAGQRERGLADAEAAAGACYDSNVRTRLLVSLAPHLPDDLLARAVAAATAIDYANGRAGAMAALARYVPAGQQPEFVGQALTAARAITFDDDRAQALTALIPLLPADQQPEVLHQALDAATATTIDDDRARALTALIPLLPADQQPEVLRLAFDAATDTLISGTEALAALAPLLPADLLDQAVASASAVPYDTFRAAALTALAPSLPTKLLAKALSAVTAIDDAHARAMALTMLARYLPAERQPTVLRQALDAAAAIGNVIDRTRALGVIAPGLPADLLGQAVATATAITDDFRRADALLLLARYEPAGQRPELVRQALAAACAITDDRRRAETLTALAPAVPADQQPEFLGPALAAATAITDDDDRAQALTALIPLLPADQQPDVTRQALAAATAITDDRYRAGALTTLAPLLPADEQPDVTRQALAAAAAITDDRPHAEALTRLAPLVPAGQQPDVIRQALAVIISASFIGTEKALPALLPLLSADQLAEALAATARAYSTGVQAMTAMIPYLPADQRPGVRRETVTQIIAGGFILGTSELATLAPDLPADLLAEALAATATITSYDTRAQALTALAPHLPADQQPGVFRRALAAAGGVQDYNRERVLTAMAPLLPADLLGEALALTPKFSRTITVLLRRARDVLPADGDAGSDGDAGFIALLRIGLRDTDRDTCLYVIANLADDIAGTGGTSAVQECADAIGDVHRWWP